LDFWGVMLCGAKSFDASLPKSEFFATLLTSNSERLAQYQFRVDGRIIRIGENATPISCGGSARLR